MWHILCSGALNGGIVGMGEGGHRFYAMDEMRTYTASGLGGGGRGLIKSVMSFHYFMPRYPFHASTFLSHHFSYSMGGAHVPVPLPSLPVNLGLTGQSVHIAIITF